LPTAPSAKNLSTAAFTVAGIGTTTSKMIGVATAKTVTEAGLTLQSLRNHSSPCYVNNESEKDAL